MFSHSFRIISRSIGQLRSNAELFTGAAVMSIADGNDLFEALIGRIAEEVVKRIGQGTSPTEPAMLSPRSVAKILDCSVSEVRRYLQTNGIPTVRFGKRGYRVPKEEFDRRLARWKKGGSLWD